MLLTFPSVYACVQVCLPIVVRGLTLTCCLPDVMLFMDLCSTAAAVVFEVYLICQWNAYIADVCRQCLWCGCLPSAMLRMYLLVEMLSECLCPGNASKWLPVEAYATCHAISTAHREGSITSQIPLVFLPFSVIVYIMVVDS